MRSMQSKWASFHGGHSAYTDGRETVAKIAQAAADRGFCSFGFSEHFIKPPHREFSPDGEVFEYGDDWVGEYVAQVQEAKVRHASQIAILLGTEVEYIRDFETWTRERLVRWPFDYVVGSVHYVRYEDEDICVDRNRRRIDEALRRAGSPEQLVLDYYDHVMASLGSRQ